MLLECVKTDRKINGHIWAHSRFHYYLSHKQKFYETILSFRLKFLWRSSCKMTKILAIFAIFGYLIIIFYHCPTWCTNISCHLTDSYFNGLVFVVIFCVYPTWIIVYPWGIEKWNRDVLTSSCFLKKLQNVGNVDL